jgi:hypothetical protein
MNLLNKRLPSSPSCPEVFNTPSLKTMFGSSLPPVVCRKARALFTLWIMILTGYTGHFYAEQH